METNRRDRGIRAIARAGAVVQRLEPRTLFAGHVNPHIDPHIINGERKNPEEGFNPIAWDPSITPGPDAPALSGTIEGVNFDSEATSSGFYNIPPDNSGAVGPSHIVNVVNTVIQWQTK